MASNTVDVKVAVKPKVSVGTSTVAGGSVSLVAFVLAAVAFWQGARDEATMSILAVGLVSLVTVLGGRYAQAVAALFVVAQKPAPATPPVTSVSGGTSGTVTNVTFDSKFDPVSLGAAVVGKHGDALRRLGEPTNPAGEVPGGGPRPDGATA